MSLRRGRLTPRHARAALMTLALCLALALGVPAGASAAADPPPSLPEIENEVMCVECGTALNISTSAVADDQREFIQARIDQGQSKEQIKQALVAEFGPDVLAMPDARGFNAAVYLVPVLLGVLALLGVGLAARRWRNAREPDDDGPGPEGSGLAPADERRLSTELASFER